MKNKKKPTKRTFESITDNHFSGMDTVALMCLAIINKSEYENLNISEVIPCRIITNEGEIEVNPLLIVGSLGNTKKQALSMIVEAWNFFQNNREGNDDAGKPG